MDIFAFTNIYINIGKNSSAPNGLVSNGCSAKYIVGINFADDTNVCSLVYGIIFALISVKL